MKKVVVLLSLVVFLVVSCAKKEQKSEVASVNFTPCQQTKVKSAEFSDGVDVEFTNEGVKITQFDFEVTCDFSAVNVTHTFVNGVLRISQQSSPSHADCVCYTDVSYTINGISQDEVNVIFVNGMQVYCYNDNSLPSCGHNVIISPSEYDKLPASFPVQDLKITGNCLTMRICSSGCDGSSWNVKLVAVRSDDTGYQPQWLLRISLENEEVCTAVPCREFSFNIEDLQIQGTDKVQLNFSGNSILYEYQNSSPI